MLNIGDRFEVPIPELKTQRLSVGVIRHLLWVDSDKKITAVSEVAISPRTKVPALTLENGDNVVLLNKKRKLPDSADRVLFQPDGKEAVWLKHPSLAAAEAMVMAGGFAKLAEKAEASWRDGFRYSVERKDAAGNATSLGLRPPQVGSLHNIGGHWSLSNDVATIVMPTGTGKTETMLATLVAHTPGKMLVVVPSRALRDQTARKFLTLGLLRQLGNLAPDVQNPVVGILSNRPKSASDLEIFGQCNVVVATIGTIAQGHAADLLKEIASRVDCLVIDEAHHVAAQSWTELRNAFSQKRVLQFTATPFRRDGKPVDGKIIYSYPLHRAQEEGYFKRINFRAVFELDDADGDQAVAEATVEQLEKDLAAGFDHIAMARCADINRATEVFELYKSIGAKYRPILVHSEAEETVERLNALRSRKSRIVVCVNMLGEGFDLPQLKIAGIHDTHKSLAVLLQFTGRFTRTAGAVLGEATVIANIANQQVSEALDRLYDEDADWNKLLREHSSKAAKDHASLVAFLEKSKCLGESDDDAMQAVIAPKNLLPKFSAVAYRTDNFTPKAFHLGLAKNAVLRGVWLNEEQHVLFFVTQVEPRVEWSRSRRLKDREWHLYVIYHNPAQNLLFIHSTDRESLHENLASAVTGSRAQIISGDNVFRSLGHINRLTFQNIGLKKPGRRNLRYSMYTGGDVGNALSPAQKSTSTKSNVSGGGFAGGEPVSFGCSYKGRIWTKDQGVIQRFMKWCDTIGAKLIDSSISTDDIIDSVLIPREVDKVPDVQVVSIDWPDELLVRSEENTILTSRFGDFPISHYSIEIINPTADRSEMHFKIAHATHYADYTLRFGGPMGFEVKPIGGESLSIKVGKISETLEAWFTDYPPSFLFTDGSELDGNLVIEPRERQVASIPADNVTGWSWKGVNVTKESQWRDGAIDKTSIQYKAAQEFGKSYELVFDDDDKGEAADLVCISEKADFIDLALVHCKFSKANPGERVKDVVEVTSQAVRSGTWIWRFPELCKHLVHRETRSRGGRPTRFLQSDGRKLNHFAKLSRFKPIKARIVIIQPGVQKNQITADQGAVFGAAHSYLQETVGVALEAIVHD
jgi:superfamily II DNA or RNA helicase